MALTKVKGSGVEGITNLSNATFLSVDASEVATLLTTAVINSEGGAVTTNIAQGLCKSWINFNGQTPAIRDSSNVGSLTDDATGTFTINFSNAMSDGNYVICGSAFFSSAGGFDDTMVVSRDSTQSQSTSACPFYTYRLTSSALLNNGKETNILNHGDLA